jgi:hypothetical protein
MDRTNENQNTQPAFDEFAILEVMGKTRLGGRVREQHVFGVAMIRIDIPDGKGGFKLTRFFHPQALFSVTLVGEKEATAVAAYNDAPPVTRWEMTQKQLPGARDDDDGYVDVDGDADFDDED